MDWKLFHIWAEETALWSTLGVNIAIILGGVSAAFAYVRSQPRQRIYRVAALGSLLGIALVTTTAIYWISSGEARRYQHEQVEAQDVETLMKMVNESWEKRCAAQGLTAKQCRDGVPLPSDSTPSKPDAAQTGKQE
jgi:hypothetical protein